MANSCVDGDPKPCSDPAPSSPRVLRSVKGFAGRTNDVVLCGNNHANNTAIFFGGDVQDLEENMIETGCLGYLNWSLERCATILQQKFPDHLIIVIRPSRKQDLLFSCYDNFVRSSAEVSPSEFDRKYGALEHLNSLLENLQKSIGRSVSFEKIILLGFSKGTVVLNQFLYELYDKLSLGSTIDGLGIIRKIHAMYWLDAGHSAPVDYWVTQSDVLEALKHFSVNSVHVFVTPYQKERPDRQMYLQQMEQFCSICCTLGLLKQKVYLFNQKTFDATTIEDHFQVLTQFSAE